MLAALVYALGTWLEQTAPHLRTSGFQMLVWGFFVSTVLLYHATFAVNSLAHVFGRRRFQTKDDSRNNLLIALLTFGEGWHNNHHYSPSSERQGFFWWEIDLSHYLLTIFSRLRPGLEFESAARAGLIDRRPANAVLLASRFFNRPPNLR